MHMTGTVQRKTNTETDKATIPQSKSCGKNDPKALKQRGCRQAVSTKFHYQITKHASG